MKLKVVQWVLALLLLAPCTQAQSIWDATHLANVKQSIHEPFYATAYQALQAEADKLLDVQPLSVMMKEKVPASGNKHDYMSQARYYWPDPTKPDGLPYVSRDGESNPELNKLDRNRERRERDHENLRGDVPLEYQAVPEPKLIPRWMNNPTYRQLMAGNFLDILFDCPYEMHNLTADPFISRMVEELSEEHKEVLYFLSLRLYSSTRLAAVRGQSDRNIRKLRKTIHKKLQRQMYDHLCGKQEHGGSLTLRERQFLEEYSKIAKKQGKDAVIRRENKTKRRKKKNRP